MEYRIKIIEKYSGKKEFIPQFREESFTVKNLFGMLLFPVLLLFAMSQEGPGLSILNYFFINWEIIKDNEFSTCSTLENAEELIKAHQKKYQDESLQKWEEEKKKKANKTLKTTYIKI